MEVASLDLVLFSKKAENPESKPEMICLGQFVAFSPQVKAARLGRPRQRIRSRAAPYSIINFRCAANNESVPKGDAAADRGRSGPGRHFLVRIQRNSPTLTL